MPCPWNAYKTNKTGVSVLLSLLYLSQNVFTTDMRQSFSVSLSISISKALFRKSSSSFILHANHPPTPPRLVLSDSPPWFLAFYCPRSRQMESKWWVYICCPLPVEGVTADTKWRVKRGEEKEGQGAAFHSDAKHVWVKILKRLQKSKKQNESGMFWQTKLIFDWKNLHPVGGKKKKKGKLEERQAGSFKSKIHLNLG